MSTAVQAVTAVTQVGAVNPGIDVPFVAAGAVLAAGAAEGVTTSRSSASVSHFR